MKRILLLLALYAIFMQAVSAQTKIITTGNNLVNTADPYAADIVIGSDQGGNRHDASMLWWNIGSASRISNTGDSFFLSQWSTTNPNIGLSAIVGGSSYFKGNVGIGTTTPAYKLDVNGDIKGSTLKTNGALSILGVSKEWQIAYDETKGGIYIDEFGINRQVYIRNGGYVGIGTADPDARLAVNGTIHAKSVLIDLNGWPDYVFKKDYRLRPLSDLQAYIDQNQHLPEISSEREMIKKGLNVEEVNKLLMKKVEELTLYLIDEHKKNKDQQKQIDQLNRKINLLANKIK